MIAFFGYNTRSATISFGCVEYHIITPHSVDAHTLNEMISRKMRLRNAGRAAWFTTRDVSRDCQTAIAEHN